jgi:hypothetical protein
MIIVEGPDGSGKSTLIKLLSTELGVGIAKRVVAPDTTPMTDVKKWTEGNVYGGFQATLFDRHRLISEPIYAPAMGREPAPGFSDPIWMCEMMAVFYANRPIIIYCLPDLQTVIDNVNNPETDNWTVAQVIPSVYAGYVNKIACDFTRAVGRMYNYKTTKPDDIVGYVRKELQRR